MHPSRHIQSRSTLSGGGGLQSDDRDALGLTQHLRGQREPAGQQIPAGEELADVVGWGSRVRHQIVSVGKAMPLVNPRETSIIRNAAPMCPGCVSDWNCRISAI